MARSRSIDSFRRGDASIGVAKYPQGWTQYYGRADHRRDDLDGNLALLLARFAPVLRKGGSIQIDRRSLPFYGSAAIFALIGQVCTFVALNGGQISVVAPLVNTTPLFVIAFTALFLRGEEKITPMVLIGVGLLVAGIGFITAR
jgi:uncharacterized membrane protein